jgi:phospholipase C
VNFVASRFALLAVVATCCSLAACGGRGVATAPALDVSRAGAGRHPQLSGRSGPAGVIQHVVVIIQENRSFDYLFNGYPGANTVQSGLNSLGQTVPLSPVSMTVPYDIVHGINPFKSACDADTSGNCRMDGFDLEPLKIYQSGYTPPPNPQYAMAVQSEVQPYWTMANQYVLADNMFQSNIDSSFVAHQYLIAGQAYHAANDPNLDPWGCDSAPGNLIGYINANRQISKHMYPCFPNSVGSPTYTTLADRLDAKSISWKYYAPALVGKGQGGYIWSAFDAVSAVRNGPDWAAHVISPPSTIISDAQAGSLPAMSWLAPELINSDHSGSKSKKGPSWVTSVVNAIGQGPNWNTTAIFVVWDDWGGWYDHVPPQKLDFDGLGFRVPLLIISPYAKQNYVSHVQYEFGSILKFAEETLGLTALAASDRRANSFDADCFDFTQSPRPFSPISGALPAGVIRADERPGPPPDEQ